MTSTIKVNNIQNQCGQNIINENSNTITIGASGDTIALASGASQSGFGRSGKLYSYEWAKIKPDILATAKGIGSGFPLGACLASKKATQNTVQSNPNPVESENTLASDDNESFDGEDQLSPMPGTFYSAPTPEDEPFVSKGDVVKKGQVLCIIEAMKIMNEIESEFDGTIMKVKVNNGDPVEYNQPLFVIKSS